jgi:TolB-like protein/DNA-binding winged helix-turn-helix (wHTH) protein
VNKDFRLGVWIVRPQRRIIEHGGTSVHVKPKPMSVLQCLAAAEGTPVSRNELFDNVWPDAEVSDETLTKCIVELRKAFGDTARDSHVIETIPKLGFRLVPPVEPLEPEPREGNRTIPQEQQSGWVMKRQLWRASLLAMAAVLILGVLLYFGEMRQWFSGDPVRAVSELPPSIAVLPFVNLSSDPEDRFFSRGISEEILNALAASNRVPVIARSSSFRFSSEARDVREIGRLLNVSHVLEGSVRRADGEVRIAVQLVDSETGLHVWAGAYQRDWSDVLQLQAEITREVVDEISQVLGVSAATPAVGLAKGELTATRRTQNLQAYQLYLAGAQLVESPDPIPREQALGYLERAIALDENYADAWAAKGRALLLLGTPHRGSTNIPADVYPDAISALRRALELDPDHEFAMAWLGITLMTREFKWADGLQLLKQAVDINPNNATLMARYGIWLKRLKREGSGPLLQRAFRLDPFGWLPTLIRSSQLQQEGRWLDAATVLETTLIGNRDGYAQNSAAAFLNLGAAGVGTSDALTREARLEAAKAQIHRARQRAHPVDLSLDVMEMFVAFLRDGIPVPWDDLLVRAKNEKLDGLFILALYYPWENENLMSEVFDLAISQRHIGTWFLFGSKPPTLPEAEWHRLREITGVAEFQAKNP